MFLVGLRAPGDLQEASVIARRALAATPPGRRGRAENLAQVAEVEFELYKDSNEAVRLDTAIGMYSELVAERPLPAPVPSRFISTTPSPGLPASAPTGHSGAISTPRCSA